MVKLSKSGRKILWKAVRAVEAHPKTFSMHRWLQHDPQGHEDSRSPYCGTVGCIAGHICLAGTGKLPNRDGYIVWRGHYYHPRGLATKLLGLEGDYSFAEASLFLSRWGTQARTLRKRIHRWLKTGE